MAPFLLILLLIVSLVITKGGRPVCSDVFSEIAPHPLNIKFEHESIASRDSQPLISKLKAVKAPTIEFPTHSNDDYYTVLMVDPDAPSHANPKMAEWLHWLIVNVPIDGDYIYDGQEIMEYAGPTPPSLYKGLPSLRFNV
eukprot:286262_1